MESTPSFDDSEQVIRQAIRDMREHSVAGSTEQTDIVSEVFRVLHWVGSNPDRAKDMIDAIAKLGPERTDKLFRQGDSGNE